MGLFSGLFRSRDKPKNSMAGSSYAFYIVLRCYKSQVCQASCNGIAYPNSSARTAWLRRSDISYLDF